MIGGAPVSAVEVETWAEIGTAFQTLCKILIQKGKTTNYSEKEIGHIYIY